MIHARVCVGADVIGSFSNGMLLLIALPLYSIIHNTNYDLSIHNTQYLIRIMRRQKHRCCNNADIMAPMCWHAWII